MSISQLNSSRFPTGYFETDAALEKIIGVDTNGRVKTRDVSSISVDTIYTADGTLAGDRVVDADGNSLGIANCPDFELDSTLTYLTNAPQAGETNDTLLSRNAISGRLEQRSVSNLKSYDAIVDASGAGDYTLLKDALDAGSSNIFVRNGTYSETAESVVTDRSISITGESIANTIITGFGLQFGGTSFPGTGTIAINENSNTVTGVGTDFLSIPVGYVLSFRGTIHQIDSVASDTELTLVNNYEGESFTLMEWTAVPPISMKMTNLSFSTGALNDGLTINSCCCVDISYVRAVSCNHGFNIDTVIKGTLNNCFASTCENYGFLFNEQLSDLTLISCISSNNKSHGFYSVDTTITDDKGAKLNFTACSAVGNQENGFLIDFRNSTVSISDCVSYNNSESGFRFKIGNEMTIQSSRASYNGEFGILIIDGFTNSSVEIQQCVIHNNTENGINIFDGDGTSVKDCYFYDNNGTSILSNVDRILIEGCKTLESVLINCDAGGGVVAVLNNIAYLQRDGDIIINNCTDSTISNNLCGQINLTQVVRTTISNNRLLGADGDDLINLDASCTTNIISGNLMVTVTGDGITIAGDNSLITGNILNSTGTVVVNTGAGNQINNNFVL